MLCVNSLSTTLAKPLQYSSQLHPLNSYHVTHQYQISCQKERNIPPSPNSARNSFCISRTTPKINLALIIFCSAISIWHAWWIYEDSGNSCKECKALCAFSYLRMQSFCSFCSNSFLSPDAALISLRKYSAVLGSSSMNQKFTARRNCAVVWLSLSLSIVDEELRLVVAWFLWSRIGWEIRPWYGWYGCRWDGVLWLWSFRCRKMEEDLSDSLWCRCDTYIVWYLMCERMLRGKRF